MSGGAQDAAAVDAELTELLRIGERKRAAALLVTAWAADVYALCRALVRDPSTAEDLSQEAFSRAVAGLAQFRGEASSRSWLLRIARNLCFDHLTRLRRQPWDEDAGEPDPEGHADEAPPVWELLSRREDAERALDALGESERAIVVLHFGHGVGYAELASAFNLREGAVRMRVSRALSRMRDALIELEPPAFAAAEEMPEVRPRAARSESAPDRARRGPLPPPAAAPASPPRRSAASSAGGAAAPVRRFGALHTAAPPALLARLERIAAAA